MLNEFLLEKHTDSQGSIMIDESNAALSLTASLINDDMPIEIDTMVEQLIESDELKKVLMASILQQNRDRLLFLCDLDILIEKILIETIERLTRAA